MIIVHWDYISTNYLKNTERVKERMEGREGGWKEKGKEGRKKKREEERRRKRKKFG